MKAMSQGLARGTQAAAGRGGAAGAEAAANYETIPFVSIVRGL